MMKMDYIFKDVCNTRRKPVIIFPVLILVVLIAALCTGCVNDIAGAESTPECTVTKHTSLDPATSTRRIKCPEGEYRCFNIFGDGISCLPVNREF